MSEFLPNIRPKQTHPEFQNKLTGFLSLPFPSFPWLVARWLWQGEGGVPRLKLPVQVCGETPGQRSMSEDQRRLFQSWGFLHGGNHHFWTRMQVLLCGTTFCSQSLRRGLQAEETAGSRQQGLQGICLSWVFSVVKMYFYYFSWCHTFLPKGQSWGFSSPK